MKQYKSLDMDDTIIKQNSLLYFATVLSTTLAISVAIMKGSEKSRILKMAF